LGSVKPKNLKREGLGTRFDNKEIPDPYYVMFGWSINSVSCHQYQKTTVTTDYKK